MLACIEKYKKNEDKYDIDLRDCVFLGEGHNGIVYKIPDGNIIKIFKDKKKCKDEYKILKAAYKDKHFPKVFSYGQNYIIREYVGGIEARKYIKENGLNKTLSLNIIYLLEVFRELKFTKLDIRCKDLYIQADEKIMLIDPKASFTRKVDFPRHLCKGLKKLGVLDTFLDVVKIERPNYYNTWIKKLKKCGLL